MIYSQETYDSDRLTDEDRTAKTLSEIADTMDSNIQFTWDTPGQNLDNRLPVLDMKLWIDRDNEGNQMVQYSFFKKEVASKYTILKRSALSNKIKKSTLLQEALRRLNNIGPGLPWDETAHHLTEYSYMLYLSGYNGKERYHYI